MADISIEKATLQRLAVMRKFLRGGWAALSGADERVVGQDRWRLAGRPIDRAAMRAEMADAFDDLCLELQKLGLAEGLIDQPLAAMIEMNQSTNDSSVERDLIRLCKQIGLRYGLVLGSRQALTPLEIDHVSAGNEFARGVLSCVAQVFHQLDQSVHGRKALFDFLLEPICQKIESPGGSGRND